MTTNDIDAIRRLADAATDGTWTIRERQSLDRRILAIISEGEGEMTYADVAEVPLEYGDDINDWRNDAEFIAAARTLVPALCDEIEQLRAELAKARHERDEYANDNTRVAVALIDVQRQLTDTRRRADGLAAELRDQQRANTAHANENQRLRDVVEAVEGYVGEHGEGEVDVWSLRELLAGRPTLEYPQGVAR